MAREKNNFLDFKLFQQVDPKSMNEESNDDITVVKGIFSINKLMRTDVNNMIFRLIKYEDSVNTQIRKKYLQIKTCCLKDKTILEITDISTSLIKEFDD